MKKKLYGVKIILKRQAENDPNQYVFMEEIVVTVKAKNPHKAGKKAKKYVKGYCVPYVNCDGGKVNTEIYKIFDAYHADISWKGVREVYSKFTTLSGEEVEGDMVLSLLNRDFSGGECI